MPRRSKSQQQRINASAEGRRVLDDIRKEADAKRKRLERLRDALTRWEDKIDMLESAIRPFEHAKGKPRTPEQNVMVAQTCIGLMKDAMEAAINTENISYLSVQHIDEAAAEIHKFKRQHVTQIRKVLHDEESLITAFGDPSKRGGGSEKYQHNYILSMEQQEYCFNWIEEQHAKGVAVTNRKLRHHIWTKFDIEMARTTMSEYINRWGLSWRPTLPRKKTFKQYRSDAIGNFLIKYSEASKDPDVVFVYIDESYICKNHGTQHSYFGKGMEYNKASGKGRRLIILHAMTKDGPLCQVEVDGTPPDNIIWNKDCPHPDRTDVITAECLWMADSPSGDYHDNVDGERFNKWIVEKCWPAFQAKYPGKKFVPVLDNAAYHHVRKIGSLNNVPKKELIELCFEYGVDYLDLPNTPERQQALRDDDEDKYYYVQDRGEYASVHIDDDGTLWDELKKPAAPSRPFVPTRAELQIALVDWLKDKRPEVLKCQVEEFVKSKGGYCIWTAPYCARAQPIEIMWAGGKNYTAEHNFNGRTMKQTIQMLREGWHGNQHLWPDPDDDKGYIGSGDMQRRKCRPLDCAGFVRTAEGFMNTLYIPIAGFKGTIDNLQVPVGFSATTAEMPIDMILNLDPEDP